jgi:AraC-like DNA-binding protein
MPHMELWFLWRGKGRVHSPVGSHEIAVGNFYLFHPGERYTVEQYPDHPFGITFLEFAAIEVGSGQTDPAPSELPRLIDGVDASFGESTSRRIVELLWEGYLAGRASNSPSVVAASPTPYFKEPVNPIHRDQPFCPMPMRIHAPDDMSATRTLRVADSLLQSLIQEVCHQAEINSQQSISSLEKHHRSTVSAIALMMQENPRMSGGIAALAHQAGYSPDHFMRTFKKIMGCSPQQFLVNTRVNNAKLLLLQSGLSIKEIAAQLGYTNAYFFSRQFKAFTGYSPTGYRESAVRT